MFAHCEHYTWHDKSVWPIAKISRYLFPAQTERHRSIVRCLPPQISFSSSGSQPIWNRSAEPSNGNDYQLHVITEPTEDSLNRDSSFTSMSTHQALKHSFGSLPPSNKSSSSTGSPVSGPTGDLPCCVNAGYRTPIPPNDTDELVHRELEMQWRGNTIITGPMVKPERIHLTNKQRCLAATVVLLLVACTVLSLVIHSVVSSGKGNTLTTAVTQRPTTVTLSPTHPYETFVGGTYRLSNETYTSDLADLQSNKSRQLTRKFCDGVYRTLNGQSTSYQECSVTKLRKGSVIVDFVLHYAGSVSIRKKESIRAALQEARGLKGLGAEFKDFTICEKPRQPTTKRLSTADVAISSTTIFSVISTDKTGTTTTERTTPTTATQTTTIPSSPSPTATVAETPTTLHETTTMATETSKGISAEISTTSNEIFSAESTTKAEITTTTSSETTTQEIRKTTAKTTTPAELTQTDTETRTTTANEKTTAETQTSMPAYTTVISAETTSSGGTTHEREATTDETTTKLEITTAVETTTAATKTIAATTTQATNISLAEITTAATTTTAEETNIAKTARLISAERTTTVAQTTKSPETVTAISATTTKTTAEATPMAAEITTYADTTTPDENITTETQTSMPAETTVIFAETTSSGGTTTSVEEATTEETVIKSETTTAATTTAATTTTQETEITLTEITTAAKTTTAEETNTAETTTNLSAERTTVVAETTTAPETVTTISATTTTKTTAEATPMDVEITTSADTTTPDDKTTTTETTNAETTTIADDETTTAGNTAAGDTTTEVVPSVTVVTKDTDTTTTTSPSTTSSAGILTAQAVCPSFLPTCLHDIGMNQLIINGTSCTGAQYFRCCDNRTYMRFGCTQGVLTGFMHQPCTGGRTCVESTDCSWSPC